VTSCANVPANWRTASLTALRVGRGQGGRRGATASGRGSQPLEASAAVMRIAAATRTRSPAIAQLAQLHEHGAGHRMLADVGKGFPQPAL